MELFGLTPRVFTAKPDTAIGELSPLDSDSGIVITAAGIDSDSPCIYIPFAIECIQKSTDTSYYDATNWLWYVVWKGEEIASGIQRYDVPIYIEYVDHNGNRDNWKGTFTVYAKGLTTAKPSVKYVGNLASKVGTSNYVTVYGHGFNDDLEVFLDRPDGSCIKIGNQELYRKYDADGYDSISFYFGNPYVLTDTTCNEICGTYGINLGYGECGANTIEAGSSDYSTAWDSNIYLIRYKYDVSNKDITEQNPGGLMSTVDPACFYSSELKLVTDESNSGMITPSSGGVYNRLGNSIYFRIKPGTDCTKLGYYRVKLKYSSNLPTRYGEITLGGIVLNEGDIVWLENQYDGSDGLWIVQPGEWIGLKTYLDGQSGDDEYRPCERPVQEPLPVDEYVLADLGAHVSDKVTVACDGDVPEERRYGSQKICGTVVNPGDIILLTNQSDGANGIWEVTCAEWFMRSNIVPPSNGNAISGDDFIIVQNDIDFCTCQHGGSHIFHIWYYYLNGACYLTKAMRTVKITCGAKGSLFPSNNSDVTDYSVTAAVNDELVTDSHRTAGDPVKETCAEVVENYDVEHRIGISSSQFNCGPDELVAPNGMRICRCDNVYNIDAGTSFSSRDRNGFSIVFWQFDSDDERWHLYAYIGAGRYDLGMNYYVYHLCTDGIASESDIDVNSDILETDSRGRPLGSRTHDSWFISHGGRLASGFGIFDDTWNFKVQEYERDGDGNYVMQGGARVPVIDGYTYSHVLNEDTLYSMWSIKCTTTFCGVRVYGNNHVLRTCCEDMANVEKTSAVMSEVYPTPDTWGFKFYNEAIGKGTIVSIWNSLNG